MPDPSEIQIGALAPDFVLPSSTGEPVRLSDFRGKSEVVLFFYPKDNSPACTAQACSFRDHYEAFRDAGAEVIGISSDSETSHQRFARFWKLPFLLVSDEQGRGPGSLRGVPDARTVPRSRHLPDRPGGSHPAYLLVTAPARKACRRDAGGTPEAAANPTSRGELGPGP